MRAWFGHRFLMPSDPADYTTDDLLRMLDVGEDRGKDFAYNALWVVLFGRWRRGIDLEPLINLLQSEKSADRQKGAFYLDEAGPPPDRMANVVVKLADDAMSFCRWRFVAYVTNSGLYGDVVADGLARCLLGSDLYVRATTIIWAVLADNERFADFSQRVFALAGKSADVFRRPETIEFWRESERKRARRAIEIAQRLREAEPIESIRESMAEEDSFVFDRLTSHVIARRRAATRRAAKAATARQQ